MKRLAMSPSLRFCAVFVLGLMACVLVKAPGGVRAQTPTAAPSTAQQRPTSTPYSGDLSIFEYPDRDKKLQIDRVMDLLSITRGKAVADIGAGSGWFTVRASRRVGSSGIVYAEDINPQYLQYIGERAKKENLSNVNTVLGTPDDPGLSGHQVDAIMLMKVYHEIAHPMLVMKVLRASMKPGGKLGIIDRNGSGSDHGLNQEVVEKEMRDAGFKLQAKYDFTKADGQDYFLIFTAR